jgi:hypothetical protein
MAQIDHDLTIVNCVDQQLRLIKNLGCHSGTGEEYLRRAHPESGVPQGARGVPTFQHGESSTLVFI